MEKLNLPVIKISTSNLNSFINYWSKLYEYKLEKLYDSRIGCSKFELNDLQQLYTWKNGMPLSSRKQKSLDEKVLAKIDIVNRLKSSIDFDVNDFLKEFNNLSAVWKIFLLHLIKPNKYPIYDQHIHRAFNFIHGLDFENISAYSISNKEKEKFYFKSYMPFIDSKQGVKLKKLDEAFFAFGQLINTKHYSKIVS